MTHWYVPITMLISECKLILQKQTLLLPLIDTIQHDANSVAGTSSNTLMLRHTVMHTNKINTGLPGPRDPPN